MVILNSLLVVSGKVDSVLLGIAVLIVSSDSSLLDSDLVGLKAIVVAFNLPAENVSAVAFNSELIFSLIMLTVRDAPITAKSVDPAVDW